MLNKLFLSTSLIEKYMEFLIKPMQHHKFGLGWHISNIYVYAGNIKEGSNYHLKFSIPYANQHLQWDILFNPLHPEIGPDFIFQDETKSTVSIRDLTGLHQWNPNIDSSLLNVILELLKLHKENQVKMMKDANQQIAIKYDLLIQKVKSEYIEVACIQNIKLTEIKFLINLSPDISNLWYNKLENKKVLLFLNCGGSSNNIITELYLSDTMKNLFDESETLSINPVKKLDDLVDYVDSMKQNISKKINSLLESLEERKKFISTVLILQKYTVIEYDIEAYKQAALYLKNKSFGFVLIFKLPNKFPNDQFSMTLHSINNMTDHGVPFQKNVQDFPYSPRWEPRHMIEKAISHVFQQEIKNFL